MTCSCPKCHAQVEIDLSSITENGTFTSCPECKSRFWINRESYARMALRKEGNTYCDKCGNELARSIVCEACGVMYPDYYLVQASKPPRRQVEKPDLFSMSFSLKPAAKQTYTYTGYTSTKKSGPVPSRALLTRACLAALVVLLAIGGGHFYKEKKAEQKYARNYMRALYGIKYGTDLSFNTCAQLSADWKKNADAGLKNVPRISEEDESRLNRIKDTTDRYMLTLSKAPKKYTASGEKLANLYGMFIRAHDLAIAPSGSLSGYTNLASKSQSDFNIAVQDLKGSLPPKLSSELKVAKAKYRGLKDI